MTILILGLIMFVGHTPTRWRGAARGARFDEGRYKIGYCVLTTLGLVFIVDGYHAHPVAGMKANCFSSPRRELRRA